MWGKISPPKLSGSRVSSEARQVAGWVRAGSRFQKPERRKGSPLSPLRVSFRQRAAAWRTAVNAAVEREREGGRAEGIASPLPPGERPSRSMGGVGGRRGEEGAQRKVSGPAFLRLSKGLT